MEREAIDRLVRLSSVRAKPGDMVPLGVSVQAFKEGAIVRLFDGRRKARIIVGVAGIEPRVDCEEMEDERE